jgi:curved DNA-binding protein CbpA
MSNHYSILGIPETATEAEIKSAFVNLAKKNHPDVLPRMENWKMINETFASIIVAYKTLRDRDKRREYDQKLAAGLLEKDDVKKNHARATFRLGIDSYKAKYYRRSHRYFKACCQLDPENPHYWSYLGLAAINSGHSLEEAEMCGKKAIDLHPSSPQYHITLGVIYKKAGKKSEAKKEFKAALKIDPNNLQARGLLKD